MQLTHRVLKIVQHLHLLIPALRSSSIRPEEEALRAALEDIDEEIRRPGGLGKMRGKLNEMWALVDAVRAARERNRNEGSIEWAVVDEDGLNHIAQVCLFEIHPSYLTDYFVSANSDFSRGASRPGTCYKNIATRLARPFGDTRCIHKGRRTRHTHWISFCPS